MCARATSAPDRTNTLPLTRRSGRRASATRASTAARLADSGRKGVRRVRDRLPTATWFDGSDSIQPIIVSSSVAQITTQPGGATEVTSARGKGAAGTAGFQNTRYIDPILNDEREVEMNSNLGCVVTLL